jgi:3-hydroxyacyl-[acyl-carrier-protein] dehydratase
MLAGSFFTIENLVVDGNKASARLHLEATHSIFSGHFPGLPVVPGVCMVQMIKEVLEQILNRKTQLKTSRNIKFLNVIDPTVYPEVLTDLTFSVKAESVDVTAKIYLESTVFFKMDAVFV